MRFLSIFLLLALLAGLLACTPAPVTPQSLPTAAIALSPSAFPAAIPTFTPTPTQAVKPAVPGATPTALPTPTLSAVNFYDPAGCRRPPDEAGAKVEVNGWTLNERTLSMLKYAQELYGGPIDLADGAVTQGSYHDNGSLSFGTHLGGGAVDLSIFLPGTWQVDFARLPRLVRALRAAGFAAWVRVIDEVYPGSGYHIHAIAVGDPQLSVEAEAQLTGAYGYFLGFDGLPREDGIPRADREGGPVVCGWMRDLGYRDLRPETAGPWPPAGWAETLSKTGESYVAAPGEGVNILAHNLYATPDGLDQALAWGLWREAGLLPPVPNPARNLRPFFEVLTQPENFWQLFPPDLYQHDHFGTASAQFDFTADPLLPGDLIALPAGGRTVLLVVTRVDEGGRAYAPVPFKGPQGWRVEMAVLSDPGDPQAGLLRNELAAAGFDRLRVRGIGLPAGSKFEYLIQPGDTIPTLAARFRSEVEAIRRANPGIQPERLPAGGVLVIPVLKSP